MTNLTPPLDTSAAGAPPQREHVFVLGDSRTGTYALHNFFVHNGLKSIHYFMQEARQKDPLHNFPVENERNFMEFIDRSPFECFTDYPTRFYYTQLIDRFPSALFILTTRDSVDRWRRSMTSFFAKFRQQVNLDDLTRMYVEGNEAIRTLVQARGAKFLEICIDDDSDANTSKLADFLGLTRVVPLSKHNSSDEIDNEILSRQHQLYPYVGDSTIDAIERSVHPSKAILSEHGWVFLVNDTNDFLKVQYGQKSWSQAEREAAMRVMRDRVAWLAEFGANYRKFIVPEKSVVYPEYLPRAMHKLTQGGDRPAQMLAADCPETVSYLLPYLQDARSYGQLYFRGDSHTNWTGAWLVYVYIARQLIAKGFFRSAEMIGFSDLVASVAAYEGDLTVQLDPRLRKEFDDRWAFTTAKYGFDITTKLSIADNARKARPVNVPQAYRDWFNSRETVVYEREDGNGMKAVIFRDSTLDFCHELLAQHFSRSVFVWHQGQVYENVLREEKPDVVLHVMAERFVIRYPDFMPIVRSA